MEMRFECEWLANASDINPADKGGSAITVVRDVVSDTGIGASVANAGLQPASNVRVIAMYADATVAVPPLPNNFWTTTFPAGSSSCGALDTSTGWHLLDPSHPCTTIPVVNPKFPEAAKFAWNVSATQAQHSCMLVVIESADDPPPATIRSSNILQSWELVPQYHQIAQRNLYIVDSSSSGAPASGSEGMNVPNETREQSVALYFDRTLLPSGATFFLAADPSAAASATAVRCSPADAEPSPASAVTPPGLDPAGPVPTRATAAPPRR
jgi:hypothetical protein